MEFTLTLALRINLKQSSSAYYLCLSELTPCEVKWSAFFWTCVVIGNKIGCNSQQNILRSRVVMLQIAIHGWLNSSMLLLIDFFFVLKKYWSSNLSIQPWFPRRIKWLMSLRLSSNAIIFLNQHSTACCPCFANVLIAQACFYMILNMFFATNASCSLYIPMLPWPPEQYFLPQLQIRSLLSSSRAAFSAWKLKLVGKVFRFASADDLNSVKQGSVILAIQHQTMFGMS